MGIYIQSGTAKNCTRGSLVPGSPNNLIGSTRDALEVCTNRDAGTPEPDPLKLRYSKIGQDRRYFR